MAGAQLGPLLLSPKSSVPTFSANFDGSIAKQYTIATPRNAVTGGSWRDEHGDGACGSRRALGSLAVIAATRSMYKLRKSRRAGASRLNAAARRPKGASAHLRVGRASSPVSLNAVPDVASLVEAVPVSLTTEVAEVATEATGAAASVGVATVSMSEAALAKAAVGVEGDVVVGGVGTIAEVSNAVGTAAEVAAASVGLELETFLAASALATAAGVAALTQTSPDPEKPEASSDEEEIPISDRVWRCVSAQHPVAVSEGQFLGVPFTQADVTRRWERMADLLGVSEEKALEILNTDATPLLVESDDVAEVLGRLAAISSKEKALDLIGWNPALLAGGMSEAKEGSDMAVPTLVDILYAGRLRTVLEDAGRMDEDKLAEIETYSYAMSSVKPLLDMLFGRKDDVAMQELCKRPLLIAARYAPNSAMRVFLKRVALDNDPLSFMIAQTTAGLGMSVGLARQPILAKAIFPKLPAIVPHLPSIYTRLSILRPHIPAIVRILDPYLDKVEPYLDRIMERMDEIEPHLPYILLHLDVLADHCGPLLDNFDVLMPYAASKAVADEKLRDWKHCHKQSGNAEACQVMVNDTAADKWEVVNGSQVEISEQAASYLPRLLPYVDFLVPRLDTLVPHLPLVLPHVPYILPYLDRLLPYIPLFERLPQASANADILIGYLGWILNVPIVPRILFIPIVPPIVARLATVLPRWPIRRRLAALKALSEDSDIEEQNLAGFGDYLAKQPEKQPEQKLGLRGRLGRFMARRLAWQLADVLSQWSRFSQHLDRHRTPELGREDEMDEDAEEKPVVLTDAMCLIPGDEPVVRVEDAPGNARRIFTGVDIRASVDDVWAIMTSYSQLAVVVPNLTENEVIEPLPAGGARLWQIGRASWRVFGKDFYFQAGCTLDVTLYPDGLPDEMIEGKEMCASTSTQVRDYDKKLPLIRDLYPRPFSIRSEGVPTRDIAMQNVLNAKGDFVHYRGVWRLQPLYGCCGEDEDMMRLTFSVECQPHWFLPVAPVESRIAAAMQENLAAIRAWTEAERQAKREAAQKESQPERQQEALSYT